MSLFWRTFLLLTSLLLGSVVAWFGTFKSLEEEPRAIQGAQQLASLVNLTRAAMVHADPKSRIALVTTLVEEENVRIGVREATDTFRPYDQDALSRRISEELSLKLGEPTIVAREVNGFEGLWIGFDIEDNSFWLLADPSRVGSVAGVTWLVWLGIALALSLLGALLMTRLINRPLQDVSEAATMIQNGRFDEVHLDEHVNTQEIRRVNTRFNLMARQLGQTESDRTLMLAGISHDLRTPLARLRLEAEMSVPDAQARDLMAQDIEQVTHIIDKFLDYARVQNIQRQVVDMAPLLLNALLPYSTLDHCEIELPPLQGPIWVWADAVECKRIVANVMENGLRYGCSHDGVLHMRCTWVQSAEHTTIGFEDQGPGVAPEVLPRLKDPFFRADAARTSATGSGLGLAIVDKAMQRMGGEMQLAHASTGGLQVLLRFESAPSA
jgi:two-component system, OmpR family, osmolarity sensor histidine kinase EnvZ